MGRQGPAPLRRDRGSVQEVGRRQRRRLLLLRADRPSPHLPGAARARRRRLHVPHRLRRPRRRALLHPHRRVGQQPGRRAGRRRGHPHRHLARRTPASPASLWIRLEPDAVAAITRDYLDDPRTGRRAAWHIEADDPPETYRQDDADLARRIRAATTWVREQAEHRAHPAGHTQRHRSALPGADHHLRLGGRRRRLRHGRLRAGRRRGPGHPGAFARVRLLEHVPVEPSAAHLQLRLRAGDHQRRPRSSTSPTARGSSSCRPSVPPTPTGCRPPGTGRAASGSAGSCPTATPEQPQVEVLPVDTV